MEKVVLGRTGLMVSPAGLGCGGYSRLGLRSGNSEQEAQSVVERALELGVNVFDTARAYGTEEIVGRAIKPYRSDVLVSTKTMFRDRDGHYMPVERIIDSLEKSLQRIGTDYVDVFFLHGVTPEHLPHCLDVIVPALQHQQSLGKVRHLGISESFRQDPDHDMLFQAITADCFDVVMVGFNLLNPGARDRIFPLCSEKGVATLIMHAVRNALSSQERLTEIVQDLLASGELKTDEIDQERPLGFVEDHPEIASLTEAAYRFCRHEPGVSVVLTGTGSRDHLVQNVAAIDARPLPEEVLEKLATVFGQVRSVSGD